MALFRLKVKIIEGQPSKRGKEYEFAMESKSEFILRNWMFETQKHLYLIGIRELNY